MKCLFSKGDKIFLYGVIVSGELWGSIGCPVKML